MSSPIPIRLGREMSNIERSSDAQGGSLDVGWLLRSKKDHNSHTISASAPNKESDKQPSDNPKTDHTPSQPRDTQTVTTPQESVGLQNSVDQSVTDVRPTSGHSEVSESSQKQDHHLAAISSAPAENSSPGQQSQKPHKRPHLLGRTSHQEDESKSPPTNSTKVNPKPSPRRSSWISSLSSKFSSSAAASPTRQSNADGSVPSTSTDSLNGNVGKPGQLPHNVPFNNPFSIQNGGTAKGETKKDKKQDEDKALTPMHTPRRPSVLVQAGKEREEHTGFLQSAFRKLSSSGSTGLGKSSASGQAAQRRIMNVDRNRERVKIADLDASSLRRVAFCVDVEIAGHASWHEVEEYEAEQRELHKAQKAAEPAPVRRQSLSMLERQMQAARNKKEKKEGKKEVKETTSKDPVEGAALKNPQAVKALTEKLEPEAAEMTSTSKPDPPPESNDVPGEPAPVAENPESTTAQSETIPSTKKKEKKKRSEAERKERKERKRRLAEANGQVPLELNGMHDREDDDSSSSYTPPGSSTPKSTLSPTTDPLRIYKRCAQLRETTVVKSVGDQISSHLSTLAEAPGTVPVLDLSGVVLALPELVTLADWLAVVPVRKILMDDCQLTDEGIRVVLSGLLGCKTAEQARHNRKLPKPAHGYGEEEEHGVIEKVSLKGNSKMTKIGWRHIALFLHMSKSLRAIDLSGIPFPDESASRVSTRSSNSTSRNSSMSHYDASLGAILAKALSERLGANRLEELILSNCSISPSYIGSIVDAALQCKLRRLGLANNNVDAEGLAHIVRYVESGICEGLDLGDNDLHNCLRPLSDSLTKENNFFAVSLSGCNLDPLDLKILLPAFTLLPNFRFVDLSNNKNLFSTQPNAVSILRKYLPQLTALKRIHLNNCGLSSEHVIALAEILPECPVLAHLGILENTPITELIHSKDSSEQEEACALFASVMTAVRVSNTLVAVEIEVPGADSNEVVKALASQVVAYTLRNMERCTLPDIETASSSTGAPDKDAPEILLHIIGQMEGYDGKADEDEPAPDDDYLLGGNAIVKALGVCLGTAQDRGRSDNKGTPGGSGRDTPTLGPQGSKSRSERKPRDMSKQLLDSARKIRTRLRPAMIREDRADNEMNYRRLQFLDSTLQRMIQRFEEEYPECRLPAPEARPAESLYDPKPDSLASADAASSIVTDAQETHDLGRVLSAEDAVSDGEADEHLAVKISRTPSNTSLASKVLAHQEGRMHRFGASIRREIAMNSEEKHKGDSHSNFQPSTQNPSASDKQPGVSSSDQDQDRLRELEERLNNMQGEEVVRFRERCSAAGLDKALRDLGVTAQELLELERTDPEGFEKFREAQLAARINSER